MENFDFSLVSQSIVDKMISDINHYEMSDNKDEREHFYYVFVTAFNKMQKDKGKSNKIYSLLIKNDVIEFMGNHSVFEMSDIVKYYEDYENMSPYFDDIVSTYHYEYSGLSTLLKDNVEELLLNVMKYPYKDGYKEIYTRYVTQTLEVFFPN
jgi:hypothetical protein